MMWEAIWALLDGLIDRTPTKEDIGRGFDGLLSKLRITRQSGRPQPITPLNSEERQAGQRALSPLSEVSQSLQKSQDSIDRMRQMLENLGKPKQDEQPREASQGPSHVIVDNAKDLKPEPQPREPIDKPEPVTTSGQSSTSRVEGLLKKLEQLQSPEWRSLSEGEKSRRLSERFTSGRPDWSRLLRTNDAGETHFRWQRPQQQASQPPPAGPSTPQPVARGPKSLRSRLSTIWMWKTRPQQLVNMGRKLQIGAGRLMALGGGNRVVSGVASGMSRLGMLMEGFGIARVTGVVAGLTGMALALPAAVSSVWGLQKSLRAFGEGVLSEQKRLAEFSGVQSRAAMITNISQIRTDMATARDTGPATVELAKEMARFRQAMQPIEAGLKAVEIKAATWGAQFGAAAAENMREMIAVPGGLWQMGNRAFIENPLAWLLGGDDAVKQLEQQRERERRAAQQQQQQQQQQQPLLPAQEFIQGLRQAMQLPGGQRRPLDPL